MSVFNKILFVFCLIFIEQKSFCPDEGHFVVLVQRFGQRNLVRLRIDMPNSQKDDVLDLLKSYFSCSQRLDHPFFQVIKDARLEKMRNCSQDRIVEKEGVARALSDRIMPFKVSYGFSSEQEASAQAKGKQVLPFEMK